MEMTFLPIVDRELRVAARRKGTFRLRTWSALVAILVTFGFLLAAFLEGNSAQTGPLLLQVLSTYTAGVALVTSMFLSADSITEERRQGMLGLFFLTNLRGYDVVLGKFLARSLNAFYALMALLPILAVSLLFGGLTGSEFWRTAAALMNTLFVALSLGTCISSVSADSRTATLASLASILFIYGVLPGVAALQSVTTVPAFWLSLCWISPSIAFYFAAESHYANDSAMYWGSLICSQTSGWLLLGFASWVVGRTWRYPSHSHQPSFLIATLRTRLTLGRKRSKDVPQENPVVWLIGDEPWLRRVAWSVVALWAIVISLVTFADRAVPAWSYQGAKVCGFLLKVLVAAQACRFMTDAREGGMLEALLCTPLRSLDILRGHWISLQKIFLWPLLVFVLFNFLPLTLTLYRSFGSPGTSGVLAELASLGLGFTGGAALGIYFVADIYAICWFGTWLSLAGKKPSLAPLWTILFIVILPSPLCFLDIIADLFFILWSVIKLHQDFRAILAQQFQPPPASLLRIGTPPVIAQTSKAAGSVA